MAGRTSAGPATGSRWRSTPAARLFPRCSAPRWTRPRSACWTALSGDSGLLNLPAAGTYTLAVTADGAPAGSYAFRIEQTAQISLTSGVPYQGALVASGQAQLFTVTVPQAGSALQVNLADP